MPWPRVPRVDAIKNWIRRFIVVNFMVKIGFVEVAGSAILSFVVHENRRDDALQQTIYIYLSG